MLRTIAAERVVMGGTTSLSARFSYSNGYPWWFKLAVVLLLWGGPVAGDEWVHRRGSLNTYLFQEGRYTWWDSKQHCQDLQSDLLVVSSAEEMTWLQGIVGEKTQEKWWIGLTDNGTEAYFKWTNGREFDTSITKWSEGEPDNGGERCAVFLPQEKGFLDIDCTELKCSLCCKGAISSSYPEVDKDKKTWHRAYRTTPLKNMELCVIKTLQDMKKLKTFAGTLLDDTYCVDYWVSLQKQDKGVWLWMDDREMDPQISPWVPGAPQTIVEEDCAAINKDGTFNDLNCNSQEPFICKRSLTTSPTEKTPAYDDSSESILVEFGTTFELPYAESPSSKEEVHQAPAARHFTIKVTLSWVNSIAVVVGVSLLFLATGILIGIMYWACTRPGEYQGVVPEGQQDESNPSEHCNTDQAPQNLGST